MALSWHPFDLKLLPLTLSGPILINFCHHISFPQIFEILSMRRAAIFFSCYLFRVGIFRFLGEERTKAGRKYRVEKHRLRHRIPHRRTVKNPHKLKGLELTTLGPEDEQIIS